MKRNEKKASKKKASSIHGLKKRDIVFAGVCVFAAFRCERKTEIPVLFLFGLNYTSRRRREKV
jgi:hypothetical protein